jgi:hypothetical protein
MERVTIAALTVACASVAVSLLYHHNAEMPVRHAFTLVLPLAVIAFPEAVEAGFRSTFHGRAHGGDGLAPGSITRWVAWALLACLVIAHHAVGLAGRPA